MVLRIRKSALLLLARSNLRTLALARPYTHTNFMKHLCAKSPPFAMVGASYPISMDTLASTRISFPVGLPDLKSIL